MTSAGQQTPLLFFVNGKKVELENPDPEMTLLQYLRRHLRLTGTKLGCGEGGCGACTVMLSRYHPHTSHIQHHSVNACLTPLCSVHGTAVTTVEGLGSVTTRLHPVQERLATSHGTQCGFCTPGFVMSMYTLLRNHPHPSAEQLETAFDGNLCRCTGYRPIIEGYRPFVQGPCGLGEQCCRNGGPGETTVLSDGAGNDTQRPENGDAADKETPLYDPTQEPIFPPYLKMEGARLHGQSLQFRSERVTWYRPTSLGELLEIKKQHPDCKLVNGNTEIGIEVKLKRQLYRTLVAATHVPDLLAVQHTDGGIRFGASVTLTTMADTLKKAAKDLPEFKTRVFSAVVEMLQWFAGDQVRNVAAVGGNIMTASPISDLNPLLLACGATVHVISTDGQVGERRMNGEFFPGYRKTALQPSDILLSVLLPYTLQNEYFFGFKQATRKEDDISIVNAGIRVLLDDVSTVREAALAFGGMAPTTVMATATSKALIGRQWNEELLSEACERLAEDLPLSAEAPGGMIQYRRSLTVSFFFKAYLQILQHLQAQDKALEVPLPQSYLSALQPMERQLPEGSQMFEVVDPDQPAEDVVHRPLVHLSALKQVTGEAVYIDDMPCLEGELYMGLVLSTQAHARLLAVDPAPALAMDGVVDFVSCKDVPGKNTWGNGDEIFASDKVTHQGQVVGVVLAQSQAVAQRAAAAVRVTYDPLEPVISIREAIRKQAFFQPINCISQGDVNAGWEAADHVIEGEVHIEAQEHFYLETMTTLAIPGEQGEMEVWVSSQGITQVQESISGALNIPQNKIVVKTKRLGGGFGGKETRSNVMAAPLAVAAHKAKRAVRCMLDRDEDMMMTGTRHPVLARYKVGFTSGGRLLSLNIDIYLNAGSSLDLSIGVMNRALFHVDNCYHLPHLKTTGYMCRTNLPSNTAFRGFGGPQGMLVMEACIAQVASFLDMAPEKLREMNFYKEGDCTHYNQVLEGVKLQSCWQDCLQQSDFAARRRQVDHFNSENRWRKRGLAIIPTKFGLSFNKLDMNQGGALVHIYTDGSVLISHGGVEMGQGLHTKVIQVASRVLGVPHSLIHIAESSTNTVPNTTPTAASMSSDIYGQAVREACEKLRGRLDEHQKNVGDVSMGWGQLVVSAYQARINLSASGFFIVPEINYDFATNTGMAYAYFSYGAACSEVEIDCLTGDHKVLRTDIVMDVGKSLNPTIDIGQIEGAFMQGYGLMVLEQYKVRPDGTLLTRGPGSYKIPSLGNIPAVFNVSLLRHSHNPRAIFSSKGVGEPPLFLAASVLHAVQDAVMSARRDAALPPFTTFHTPATPDRIRLACVDRFTQQFDMEDNGPVTPWYVEL
ncbi:xanthine dehydrogenase/oxidase-like isoform X2 [Babylonia areolata]|uniref:xanthine dehydrogenase/oxidase-like isoform X2 n=1 Tax=Babylonia areolata TaxID=304850 RepID=UPI003FD2B021